MSTSRDKWRQIQAILGTAQDAIPGVRDDDAIATLRKQALQEYRDSKPNPLGDINRTDWRGFKDVDINELANFVPPGARFLLPFFVDNARRYNLNPLFLLSISKHETGNWTSNVFRTKANAMGISDIKGAITQASYDASIRLAALSLARQGGYYSKAKTLADVGAIYAPVGAGNDPTNLNHYWPAQVAKYWAEFEKGLNA